MLKAVVFDFGQTLVNYKYDSPRELLSLFRRASHLTYEQLRQWGSKPPDWLRYMRACRRQIFWALFKSWLLNRDYDGRDLIHAVGRQFGMKHTPGQVDTLAELWYQPARELATLEPQMAETLRYIHKLGLKVGLISNTVVPGFVLDHHLRDAGVLELFDVRIYSSRTRVRKPHQKIFKLCLEQLHGLLPQEVMFVGDKLKNDVAGPQKLGMVTVLKNEQPLPRRGPKPDFQIVRLSELPAIVDAVLAGGWSRSGGKTAISSVED